MIFKPACACANLLSGKLPRGMRFLFGGLVAALLVLTLTAASLFLPATAAARRAGSGDFHLPPPALSLAIAPAVASVRLPG
jgi:hypothetical protein